MIEGEENTLVQYERQGLKEPMEVGVESEDIPAERSFSMDSITHPYMSLMNDTSFPRCHLTATPAGKTETYTRSMLMHGHGFPVWDPDGNINRPEKHVLSGVSIGDVGVFDKQGNFECFFNIFLPRTDEIQTMCPPDMAPLLPAPSAADIATDTNYFPPGTTLVSKHIKSKELSASPMHINFKIKAREGGILVLPQGASREDLISTTRLREYIHQHALSWYGFMNKAGYTMVPNGSLFVVTGCDKAPSWAVAASHPQIHRVSDHPFAVNFREDKAPVWETSFGAPCGRSSQPTDQPLKYSVFLRGMKIAVSIPDWTSHILHNKPPLSPTFYNLLAVPITGLRALYQTIIERLKDYPEEYLSQHTNFVFHPSDILLRFMLEESPGSQVAIVEDVLLTENYKTIAGGGGREVANFLVRVVRTHDVQNEDGLVTLVPKAPILEEQSKSSNYIPRSLLFIPPLFKQWHKSRNERKYVIDKLSKIYPGPPVPPENMCY